MLKKLMAVVLVAVLLTSAGCGKNAAESGSTGSSGSKDSGSKEPGGGAASPTGAAAGSSQESPAASPPAPISKTPPTPDGKVDLGPLKPGDKAEVGPVHFTLQEVATVTEATGLPAGYTYVLAKILVRNGDSPPYVINITDHIKLRTPERKSAPYNPGATALRSPRLQGTLSMGESQSGWLGFLAKQQEGQFTLTFTHPDHGEATWTFTLE